MLTQTVLCMFHVGAVVSTTIWSWDHATTSTDIATVLKNEFNYTDHTGNFGIGASDSLWIDSAPHTSHKVLKVYYKQGTYSSHNSAGHHCQHGEKCHRGAQFYIQPKALAHRHLTTATLEYEVLFESNFPWANGGKLPGLWGGTRTCSGGNPSETCFSTRLMWREHGKGEVYPYVTHHQDVPWSTFCNKYKTRSVYHRIECTHGNYGLEMGTGSFSFRTNHWTKVKQTLKLNSHSSEHGSIAIWIDDHSEIYVNDITIRHDTGIYIDGIFFSTFFGGNDKSFKCPDDTHTYFRNFRLSTDSPVPSQSELVG